MPRRCLFVVVLVREHFGLLTLADQFRIRKALSYDLPHGQIEAVTVSTLALIEPEGPFVEIAGEMKRLDADVGGTNPAASIGSKILQPRF